MFRYAFNIVMSIHERSFIYSLKAQCLKLKIPNFTTILKSYFFIRKKKKEASYFYFKRVGIHSIQLTVIRSFKSKINFFFYTFSIFTKWNISWNFWTGNTRAIFYRAIFLSQEIPHVQISHTTHERYFIARYFWNALGGQQ